MHGPLYLKCCHQMSHFKAYCTKFDFIWGSTSDSTGGAHSAPPELTALPQTPSWIKGVLLLKGGRGVDGEKREGRGGTGHILHGRLQTLAALLLPYFNLLGLFMRPANV